MSGAEYVCPECGGTHFQMTVTQLVDVFFFDKGTHRVTDGPTGDMEWGDDTNAICNGCGWSGKLKEAKGK